MQDKIIRTEIFIEDFEVGKSYTGATLTGFCEMHEGMDYFQDNFYGEEIIGKEAIHIQYKHKDLWFIFTAASSVECFYKCVAII